MPTGFVLRLSLVSHVFSFFSTSVAYPTDASMVFHIKNFVKQNCDVFYVSKLNVEFELGVCTDLIN